MRRRLAWAGAGLGLALLGAWLGLGALEGAAGRRLQAEAAARGLSLRWGDLSLGLEGLRLSGVVLEGAARGFTGEAQIERITVRLGWSGGPRPVAVALEGLRARVKGPDPAQAEGLTEAPRAAPQDRARPVITLRDGEIRLTGPAAGTVRVSAARFDGALRAQISLALTAQGRLEGAGTLTVRRGEAGLEARLEGRWAGAAGGLAGEATALAGGQAPTLWLAAEGLEGRARRGGLLAAGQVDAARWQAGVLRLAGGRLQLSAEGPVDAEGGASAGRQGWAVEVIEAADLAVALAGPVGLPPIQIEAARWTLSGPLWARGRLGAGRFDGYLDGLPPTLGAAEVVGLPFDSAWLGAPGATGRLTGQALLHGPGPLRPEGPLTIHAEGAVADGRLQHRLLGAAPVEGLSGAVRLDLDRAPGQLAGRGILRRGAVVLRGEGAYTASASGGHITLQAAVDPVDCQAAVDALPASALGPWQGLRAEGRWRPELRARLPLGQPQAVELTIRGFTGRCRFTGLTARLAPDPGLTVGGAPADRQDVLWLNEAFKLEVRQGVDPGLERFVGPGSGAFVPLNHLPAYVGGAAYLSEEMGFWRGGAISPGLIARAIATNLAAGRAVYGGSTVVQQLTKNLFLDREKTLLRKLQEAVIAARITDAVPKARVLELYLNCIELGPNLFGIGPAARVYFGKPASALTPREAIFLAMLKPAPREGGSYRARGSEPDYPWWRGRVVQLADRLLEAGQISAAQRQQVIDGGPLRWSGGAYLGQLGANQAP